MKGRIVWVCLFTLLSACQGLPDRQTMLHDACANNPCRSASLIHLSDADGERHPVTIPAGPILAGGILSVMTGERHSLTLMADGNGDVHPSWQPAVLGDSEQFRVHLRQVEQQGRHYTQLSFHNPLPWPLMLRAEQYPISEERFFPLTLPPISPGETVHKRWPHTILEVQITAFRVLQ